MHCDVGPAGPGPTGIEHPKAEGMSLFGQGADPKKTPLPRGAQLNTFGGSPATVPAEQATADGYETRPGFCKWMKSSGGIGRTKPRLPSSLHTSSAARPAVPWPRHLTRIGSLSW